MKATAFERFIHALEDHGVTVAGGRPDQRYTRCPAHDDRQPSLSITAREGRVMVHCHGPCETADVLDALGLTMADLYDEPLERRRNGEQPRPGRVVAEYPYHDEHGLLVYVKERLEPKRFRQKRPDPNGAGWLYNLQGIEQVLYRLPAVLRAVEAGERVWVVEGEKDADAIRRVGETATTNSGGAGKWATRLGDALTGAAVIVVADRDETGRKHATTVAADLAGRAASMTVVEAVEGKDAADHLAAGHTLDELAENVQPVRDAEGNGSSEAPGRRLRAVLASDVTTRRVQWLWDLRIVLGALTLLAGREGVGKSTLAVAIAAMVTKGTLPGELCGKPRTVIYVDSEDARDTTIVPRLEAAGADLSRVVFLDAIVRDEDGQEFEDNIVLPLDTDRLAGAVRAHDAGLVVLDAATSTVDAQLDGDKDREMRQALERINRRVGEGTGASVLGIVHFGKRDSADIGKLILGTIAWSQVARATLAAAVDEEGRLVVSRGKGNLGAEPPSVQARIVSVTVQTSDGPSAVGRVEWLGETTTDARDLLIVDAVGGPGELADTAAWIKGYLEDRGGSAAAGELLKAAKKDGHAERTVQRARERLGLGYRKTATAWEWFLPGAVDPETESTAPRRQTPKAPSNAPRSEGSDQGRRQGAKAPDAYPRAHARGGEAAVSLNGEGRLTATATVTTPRRRALRLADDLTGDLFAAQEDFPVAGGEWDDDELSAEDLTVQRCERCKRPADKLILMRCQDCAYPPGSEERARRS